MMIQRDSFARCCAVLAVVLPGVVAAQALPGDLLNCKNLADETKRLACYDAAMMKDRTVDPAIAATVPAEAAPAKPKSKWNVREDTSAMTDDTNHFATTTSTGYVTCSSFGNPGPLTILARCMENTTALIISGDCHLASGFDGYGEVTMRTDGDKAFTKSFEVSTDNSALGLWTGGRAIPVIQSMFGKDRLVIRLTPFGMSPIEATFDITGLEEAIQPLREECGW